MQDASYDVMLVRLVPHYREPHQRQSLVTGQGFKLKPNGKFYLKEPTEQSHRIPPDEIARLMAGGAMEATDFKMTTS
jgi:hypothetical protein